MMSADTRLACSIVPAVNREPRRGISQPNMLILHYTGMRSAEKAVEWLACAESKVSCHYVVDEKGAITQLVPEAERAWHAGVSFWLGETDINSASIGIEIQNPGHEMGYHDFFDAQIAAVIALSADIVQRHSIAPERVLAHSDIAPHRKIDPGEKFPWDKLAAAGIGHWVKPSPARLDDQGLGLETCSAAIREAQDLFANYGYEIPRDGTFGQETERVVRAFQRHFRPERTDGRLDLSTLSTLERLLQALPSPPVA
jgi:N-acetylmuramoyl-L-alanine amidase